MGWGHGADAKKSSGTVIRMLDRLLSTGFDKDISIGLINSAVNLSSTKETYATIDISILDLVSRKYRVYKKRSMSDIYKN